MQCLGAIVSLLCREAFTESLFLFPLAHISPLTPKSPTQLTTFGPNTDPIIPSADTPFFGALPKNRVKVSWVADQGFTFFSPCSLAAYASVKLDVVRDLPVVYVIGHCNSKIQ